MQYIDIGRIFNYYVQIGKSVSIRQMGKSKSYLCCFFDYFDFFVY